MVTVTKKHQTSLALIAVVLATVMITGTFAMDNSAFAHSHGDKKSDSDRGNSDRGNSDKGRSGLDNFGSSNFGSRSGQTAAADQSISESCDTNQNSPVTTSGFLSPQIASGINVGACLNLNLGGNAATQDQSTQN